MMNIIEEGKIRKEIRDIKIKVRVAVQNNDPETVMQYIRRIQELDHKLYDD